VTEWADERYAIRVREWTVQTGNIDARNVSLYLNFGQRMSLSDQND